MWSAVLIGRTHLLFVVEEGSENRKAIHIDAVRSRETLRLWQGLTTTQLVCVGSSKDGAATKKTYGTSKSIRVQREVESSLRAATAKPISLRFDERSYPHSFSQRTHSVEQYFVHASRSCNSKMGVHVQG